MVGEAFSEFENSDSRYGRSLRPNMIGINRYTLEITQRLEGKLQIIVPHGLFQIGRGIPWEQGYLPLRIKPTDLLWSPANSGPIRIANQVLTLHDIIPLDHPEWIKPWIADWYAFLLPRLVNKARMVITDSQFSFCRIKERFNLPEERILTIPLGVSPRFQPINPDLVQKMQQKYQLEDPYFFTIGSFEPRKNLNRLFQAWEKIRQDEQKLELVVAGISGYSFSNTGFQSVPDGVRLLGYVEDCDLPALYSGATGMIHISLYEGFGLTVLEAMACGTPVITSNTTSLPEVAGDAAILVDPCSLEEICEAIKRIIMDEGLRKSLREKGFERVKQFSWDDTAQKVWKVLAETLEEINQ